MTLERLTDTNTELFEKAFSLYESAFPVEERRDQIDQIRVLKHKDYHFDIIKDEDALVGIMLYWMVDDLIFLEHFAMLPELRGNGLGKTALELLKSQEKTILLEIETPVDEITNRRYGFYRRNGFVMNRFRHIQAKYHLGDSDLELKIMSFPSELSNEQYRGFYEYMTREIGIQPNVSSNFYIRSMNDGDDIAQIAKLIYLTDPYVYPTWFDNFEQGVNVISKMINLPTLYNKSNITVAVDNQDRIAGIIVSRQTPFVESISSIQEAFALAGEQFDERSQYIFTEYYQKMGSKSDGYYLANVSVDPNFRRQGVAAALLSHILKGREFCTLECIVANYATVRLYQRMGFKIAYEYPGVCSIPCYKMIYRR